MESEVKRIQTADFILWILIAVTLFFLPTALDAFNFPKQWILVSLTFGLVIHFIVGGKNSRNPTTKLTQLISLFAIATSLSIVFSAWATDTTLIRALFGYPGRANGILTYFCILIIVWIAARVALTQDFQSKVESRLLFTYALFALYSIIQFLDLDPVPWNNPYNPIIGTLGNPNFSGAFLGVASAVTLGAVVTSKGAKRKIHAAFSAILLALALATQSVQAPGIFLIGLAILILVFAFQKLQLRKFIMLAVSFAAIGVGALLSFLGIGPLGQSLYQYTLRLRLEYWRIGLEIVREFPFTGIGPDSYVEGFRLFRGSGFVGKYSQNVTADSAHNVLINFMANFGILAFLSYFALILLISGKAIKILFSKHIDSTAPRMLALSWLLLLTQSFFSLEQIGLNVFQWCCGALLLNPSISFIQNEIRSEKKQKVSQNTERLAKSLNTEISVLLMIGVIISTWSFVLKQEISLQRLYTTPSGTKLGNQEIAVKLDSFSAFTKDEIRRANYLSDFLLRVGRYDESIALMENVARKDPDAFEALEQLARLARFKSNLELELKYRKMIEKIDPYNYGNLLSIAQTSKELGNIDNARAYAEKVLSISKDQTINESATTILTNGK